MVGKDKSTDLWRFCYQLGFNALRRSLTKEKGFQHNTRMGIRETCTSVKSPLNLSFQVQQNLMLQPVRPDMGLKVA